MSTLEQIHMRCKTILSRSSLNIGQQGFPPPINVTQAFPPNERWVETDEGHFKGKTTTRYRRRPAEVPGKLLINPVQRILLSRPTSARGQQGNNYPGRGEQVPALGQTLNGCGAFFSLAPCVNFYQQD